MGCFATGGVSADGGDSLGWYDMVSPLLGPDTTIICSCLAIGGKLCSCQMTTTSACCCREHELTQAVAPDASRKHHIQRMGQPAQLEAPLPPHLRIAQQPSTYSAAQRSRNNGHESRSSQFRGGQPPAEIEDSEATAASLRGDYPAQLGAQGDAELIEASSRLVAVNIEDPPGDSEPPVSNLEPSQDAARLRHISSAWQASAPTQWSPASQASNGRGRTYLDIEELRRANDDPSSGSRVAYEPAAKYRGIVFDLETTGRHAPPFAAVLCTMLSQGACF